MTSRRSFNQLLKDANCRLYKAERFLNCGKVKQARNDIVDSINILSRALVSLKRRRAKKKMRKSTT
ncbi:MAG: hypothetical protein E7L01_13805 [Paenibacillus macerans]|uniref:Uncharacterized protein n=1 Tax=Paenibacillus macerans TaxID=44252 RepID=A0A090ZP75_PAEMA|nr:hypothetical protein [Paenibacillus macerans]KFN12233.1 hypothetical protein DJ90_2067 [Paenibacillus macerans]MCY7561225.1 hypothetical protein [Paenibacillus macerans]MDU7474387.1 hypothetical protein [Paenibacillus macerans]MEC0150209.1 hypothetical protein [Paenibacillus macerans]